MHPHLQSLHNIMTQIMWQHFWCGTLINWLGFNAVFLTFSQSYHGGQFTYSCVSWFSHTTTAHNNLSNWLVFHINLVHWWKTNDACRIAFCQTSERKLAEPGFELTTPGLTARVSTDWATVDVVQDDYI